MNGQVIEVDVEVGLPVDPVEKRKEDAVKTDAEIQVEGLATFRKVVCLSSLVCCAISILILCLGNSKCDTGELIVALGLCCGVQGLIFLLLLAHYIHLGHCIRKCGKWMGLFYLVIVGVMCGVQVPFFHGSACKSQTPLMYWWLLCNVVIFYVFIAFGLSLWGAYICWAQEADELLVKDALEYRKKTLALHEDEKVLMIEGGAPNQPLLSIKN